MECLITYYLQEFLLLDELKSLTQRQILASKALLNGNGKEIEKPKPTGLVLANVSASWQPDSIVQTLRNISLTANPGEFIGIAGLVGSGKVSFSYNPYRLYYRLSVFVHTHTHT